MNGPFDTTFERFFETKTACDFDGTMAFFAPALATYTDATLGWDLDGYDTLKGVVRSQLPVKVKQWLDPAGARTAPRDAHALLTAGGQLDARSRWLRHSSRELTVKRCAIVEPR
jgi:hypothetical protein